MRNQYPDICYFCGEYVQSHQGHFERQWKRRPKWKVIHFDCVFQQRRLKQCIKSMLMARMQMKWIEYFQYRRQAYFIVKSLPGQDKSLRGWPGRKLLCDVVNIDNGGLVWLSNFLWQ